MNKIFICTHTDFKCPVKNEVYEIIDIRKAKKVPHGLRSSFYSELLSHKKVASRRRRIGDIVGFCGYRRYFDFLDDVPDLDQIIAERGCITTLPLVFPGGNLRTQYASCLNVEDLDIVTGIIYNKYPDFYPAWDRCIKGNKLHAGNLYIMLASKQKEMINLVFDVLDDFVNIVGEDIDARINQNKEKYMFLPESARHEYQYRMGGHLGERITSAWIDWQFPNALNVDIAPIETAE